MAVGSKGRLIQVMQDAVEWFCKDRSAGACWLRENCEHTHRFIGISNFKRDAWVVKHEVNPCIPDDIEIGIVFDDGCVRAYASDGLVKFAEIRIKSQTKWRDSLIEAIFWTMGIVDGFKIGIRHG